MGKSFNLKNDFHPRGSSMEEISRPDPHPLSFMSTLHSPLEIHPTQSTTISPVMQPSIDSQQSLDSQTSMQSQSSHGLLSHMSTLGFLPSLASFFSDIDDAVSATLEHRCIVTIRGEQGSLISSLVVMGDYLYAGTGTSEVGSNSIRVWQKISMKECAGFGAGCASVKCLVVTGDQVLSAHQDRKIRIWSCDKVCGTKRLRPKQVIEGDNHVRQDVLQGSNAANNSHKLLASMPTVKDYLKTFIPPKNYVQVRRHHKRLWIEHVDTISMLAVGGTTSDPILYSASWDRTIKVWNISEFKCIESFKAHDDAINALLVAPDGFLYSASADAKVKVWGRQSGVNGESGHYQKHKQKHFLVACLEAHKSAVNALSLIKEKDGNRLTFYSGGSDRGIVVWEREDGIQHMTARGVLRGHRNAVLCLASAGNMLCSGAADRTIRVWQRIWRALGGVEHSCIALLQGHGGPVKCLSLSVNAEGGHLLIYSSSLDNEIKLWQLSGCVEGANSLVYAWKFPSV
ncbi:hypothetical protein L7F22_024735 [Adiantum nelumboides]|nr:hypothetical protein [Adiantum nelumboides]